MTYIIAFHPNNIISRPGKCAVSLVDFRKANPNVPLVDGQFFQLDEDRLIIMNANGAGNDADMSEHADLISSIKNPATPDLGKFYPSDTIVDAYLELDSMQGSVADGDGVATSFVVENGLQVWVYRNKTDEELQVDVAVSALAEIARLEAAVTSRRIREAMLTTEGTNWLIGQENKITTQRNKL